MTRDQLQAWINTLRLMLERGELAEDVAPIGRSRLRAVDYWQTRPAKKRRASSNETKRALAADLVLLGPVTGSAATDGLESFALGDLPGISMVLVDGEPLVTGRSEQTPPTRRPARRGLATWPLSPIVRLWRV